MNIRAGMLGSSLRSAAVLALVSSGITIAAQTQAPARRKFEVASIRQTNSGPPAVYKDPFVFSQGGRFTATNVTLTDVIVMSYKTRRIQMRGGPAWIDSDRFDIIAKADETDGEVKPEQWAPMVQALLEDRFKLMLHRETQERTVLALVVGKTAPKLLPAKEAEKKALVPGAGGQMNFQNMPIVGLVNTLANILHTPVVDGTGIRGSFDFTLDPMQYADTSQPLTPGTWPDLVLTAVRDELGFKLEKQKASLEITIIDHAEKPTGN